MFKQLKKLSKPIILTGILILFSFGTLVGCSSKKSAKNPSIKDMSSKITENMNMSELKQGDESKLKKFYNIDVNDLEEFSVYFPASNLKTNELALLKVKDADKVDEIKKNIEKRIEKQSTSFKDYLPDEYYLIEKNVLKTKDNYILFVISKDADKVEGTFDEFFK